MLPARVGKRKKLPPPGHPGWGPKSDPLRLGMRGRGCKSTWNLCRARDLPDVSCSARCGNLPARKFHKRREWLATRPGRGRWR